MGAVSKQEVEFLRHTKTTDISDVYIKLGLTGLRMHGIYPLKPYDDPYDHMAGQAVTIKMVPAEAPATYLSSPVRLAEVPETANEGDVIVVDCMGDTKAAAWGFLVTSTCIRKKLSGTVIDGGCRDITEIRKSGYPLFTKGISMCAYINWYLSIQANVPIHCGGAVVKPGDIVVGDDNGVIVVPQDRVSEVIEEIKEIKKREDQMLKEAKEGKPWREIYSEAHIEKYRKKEDLEKIRKGSK